MNRDPIPEPLIPVGRSCDCGYPMVWRHGSPSCAVWGSHKAWDWWLERWDRTAPCAELVRLVMEAA